MSKDKFPTPDEVKAIVVDRVKTIILKALGQGQLKCEMDRDDVWAFSEISAAVADHGWIVTRVSDADPEVFGVQLGRQALKLAPKK